MALRGSWVLGVTPVLLSALQFAHAAGDADAAKGLIADRCVKCHETPYSKPGERTEAVQAPSFLTMANDPGSYPPEKMRETLRQPHFPMQQFTLSRSDIENVLAYLGSLRK